MLLLTDAEPPRRRRSTNRLMEDMASGMGTHFNWSHSAAVAVGAISAESRRPQGRERTPSPMWAECHSARIARRNSGAIRENKFAW